MTSLKCPPISQIPYDSSVSMKAAETPKSLAMAWREKSKKKRNNAENWLENVFLCSGDVWWVTC